MKMAEAEQSVVVSCIVDFDDVQVWLRRFTLNLNACKDMKVFFKIWPENVKNAFIPLPAFRFKLMCLNQTCRSSKIDSKSTMQRATPFSVIVDFGSTEIHSPFFLVESRSPVRLSQYLLLSNPVTVPIQRIPEMRWMCFLVLGSQGFEVQRSRGL